MNKKLLILSLLGLLLPSLVFAYTYERTPSGLNIYNPVNFALSFNTWEEIKSGTCNGEITGWGLVAIRRYNGDWPEWYSEILDKETLSYDFIESLPFGDYREIRVGCYEGDIFSGWGQTLEYNGWQTIFIVGEAPPPAYNYLSFPTGFVASLKATTGEFFSDLAIPLVLVISLPIAFWILDKVISLMRSSLSKKT